MIGIIYNFTHKINFYILVTTLIYMNMNEVTNGIICINSYIILMKKIVKGTFFNTILKFFLKNKTITISLDRAKTNHVG